MNDEINTQKEKIMNRVNQIELVICVKANFLAALALTIYTEFLGGLHNNDHKNNQANYLKGLEKMGKEYSGLSKKYTGKESLWKRVRCKLVHEFFIGGESIIWLDAPSNCGIEIDENNTLKFYPRKYFEDLKSAFEEYFKEIESDQAKKRYFNGLPEIIEGLSGSGVLTYPKNGQITFE